MNQRGGYDDRGRRASPNRDAVHRKGGADNALRTGWDCYRLEGLVIGGHDPDRWIRTVRPNGNPHGLCGGHGRVRYLNGDGCHWTVSLAGLVNLLGIDCDGRHLNLRRLANRSLGIIAGLSAPHPGDRQHGHCDQHRNFRRRSQQRASDSGILSQRWQTRAARMRPGSVARSTDCLRSRLPGRCSPATGPEP